MKNKSKFLFKVIRFFNNVLEQYAFFVFLWLCIAVFSQINNRILTNQLDGVFLGLDPFFNIWKVLRGLGLIIGFFIGLFELITYFYFIETKKIEKANKVKREFSITLRGLLLLVLSYYLVGFLSDVLNIAYYYSIALYNS